MSIVHEAIACLAPALPAGSRLIVFGSHASGTSRADSDIDLLVVEPQVSDRYAEMSRLATLLGRSLIPADVVVMSVDSFEHQKTIVNTLAWLVAREGQELELTA